MSQIIVKIDVLRIFILHALMSTQLVFGVVEKKIKLITAFHG